MRTSLASSLLASALLWSGCSSTLVQQEFYSLSHPKYAIAVDKEGRKEGVETWWHANGNKKYEALNRKGVREGLYSAWHENGTLWYQGYEAHGKPESTLTYWRPDGTLKSQALFRDGIQLERRDYDENGRLVGAKPPSAPEKASLADDDAVRMGEMERMRKATLQMWAMRVRRTVESFWVLPRHFEKERPYRAVARIKVGRDGKILGVVWAEKSPSPAFNNLAQQTFKRIKRLPSFPPQIQDQTLEVQYEFISLGKPVPRKKLEARESAQE